MTRRLPPFGAVALLLGGSVLFFAWIFGGSAQLAPALAAYGLTAVPSLATLAWANWAFAAAPELRLVAGLGGSMVRMAVALGGGFALHLTDPARFDIPFWIWLAVFYLAFLALEITWLVQGQELQKSGEAGEREHR